MQHSHPVCDSCHAGLAGFSFPVLIHGKGPGCIRTVCGLHGNQGLEQALTLHAKVADLGLSEQDVADAVDSLAVVSDIRQVSDWIALLGCYLAETHGYAHSTEDKNDAKNAPTGRGIRPPTYYTELREAVSRHMVLSPPDSGQCRGCSEQLIAQVVAFVEQQFHLPFSSQLVACTLGFEPSYFGKAFKKHRGVSLTKHVKRVRLSRAKDLLAGNPYLSVAEIATRTGFTDASYFTRTFRSIVGITPSQFRDIVQGGL